MNIKALFNTEYKRRMALHGKKGNAGVVIGLVVAIAVIVALIPTIFTQFGGVTWANVTSGATSYNLSLVPTLFVVGAGIGLGVFFLVYFLKMAGIKINLGK